MKRASIFPIRSEKVNLKFYEDDVVLVQKAGPNAAVSAI